jgi:hypothetical protein
MTIMTMLMMMIQVIDRLLPTIADLLSPDGRLYMVLVDENKPKVRNTKLLVRVLTRIRVTGKLNLEDGDGGDHRERLT